MAAKTLGANKMFENQVIQGDALEVLKTFPPECIDLTITSPPYNLGNNHHTGNNRHSAYSDDLPEYDYQLYQINVLNELYRVTSPTGSLFYNHKNRIKNGRVITPYEWLLKSAWVLKQEIVWFNGSQNFDKCRFYPMTERIYWLAKTPNTKLINNVNKHDFWEFAGVGVNKVHSRAFPEKLVETILKCFPDARLILDPFCGSGTTLYVARKLDRNYLGIDIMPQYVDLERKRLSQIPERLEHFIPTLQVVASLDDKAISKP